MENGHGMPEPIRRSALRQKLGLLYYAARRKLAWIVSSARFAKRFSDEELPYTSFAHRTVLLRKLKDVDMWLQENKVTNLTIACRRLNHVTVRPGEVFSYWRLIGKPSRRKGYVPGMILNGGRVEAGVGGGLCQLSNLIFWMTVHTPLTVIERHRHGYDVFPDANRTQPFGSGATCFYPHGDLMIRNDTQDTYQLAVHVGPEYLEGKWLVSAPPEYRFEIVERNHRMEGEYWGGYSRHNELYQQKYTMLGEMLEEKLIAKNDALMMYAPFLNGGEEKEAL